MKIFICSTSFDLEDLRALIVDRFSGKHEFIHFEDAAFPSRRGLHSHDQCIEAVKQADVVLCIVDKRYGGKYHGARAADFPNQEVIFKARIGGVEKVVKEVVPTKALSISWCELLTAYREQKYVITFARKRTMDEKATRRENQDVASFKPAHVDNVRVFDLLDWITKQPKDNWIIPFDNAVDFLKKLEKWLDVADASLILPKVPAMRGNKPITVVVEGKVDAKIVKSITDRLDLHRPVSLVVAEGKRPLLGNLAVYTRAFKDSAGIVVLADADTSDPAEIKLQKSQFQSIIRQSDRPDTHLVLAVPEIEAWLGKTEFKRENIRHFNKLFEELHFLEKDFAERIKAIPSLKEFVDALLSLDAKG